MVSLKLSPLTQSTEDLELEVDGKTAVCFVSRDVFGTKQVEVISLF